jgi:glycosyltransferase involved in cell wall biosynthesis
MTTTNPTKLDVDVIVNAVEINDRHGVGVLLQRIFKDRSRIFTIRALNLYGGNCTFGRYDHLLGAIGLSRTEIFDKIQKVLAQHTVNRVLCIPYHAEEIFAALAVHEIFGAKICTYLMDDQNVITTSIPDELMAELLAKSALTLAISPEMRDVYVAKYQVPIHFVPPVIPAGLVADPTPHVLPIAKTEPTGAIFGNIWSPQWLNLLRTMTRETGEKIDWYGNTGADWNFSDREQLSDDGIVERGFLPTEAEVVAVLRKYAYVVVPSGTLDHRDDNLATSWLSLPSRIPFVLATANTPVIVLGHPSTAAARFVERFGIGIVADYDPASFRAAVAYITKDPIQQRMRDNAASIAPQFVNEQMDEWIWESVALGKPIDHRFEALLTKKADYADAFTTCLTIIREQKAEIARLKVESQPSPAVITYLKQDPIRWQKLRRIWLRLKGQI